MADRYRVAKLHWDGRNVEALALADALLAAGVAAKDLYGLRNLRADILAALGDYDAARAEFERTIAECPRRSDTSAAFMRSIGHERTRDLAAALAISERYVRWDPRCLDAHELAVDLLCALGREAEARAHLSAAIDVAEAELTDDDWELASGLLKMRARLLARHGDAEAARRDRARIEEIEHPGPAPGDDLPGLLAQAQRAHDPVEELALLDRAVALASDDPDVRYERALRRLRANDPRGAAEDCSVTLALLAGSSRASPRRHDVVRTRSHAHARLADDVGLLADLDEMIALAPADHTYLSRAEVLARLGRHAEALRDIDLAMPDLDPELEGDIASALELRAFALAGLGRLDDAARDRERAGVLRAELARAGRSGTMEQRLRPLMDAIFKR